MIGVRQDVKILRPCREQDYNEFIWNNKDKVIYGPVASRRLGNSLGINLFPEGKLCDFHCVYCDCNSGQENKTFAPLDHILEEIKDGFLIHQQKGTQIDYITFAGNGEPTLHSHFPEVVQHVLQLRLELFTDTPIAIFTNCMNLHKPKVEKAISQLDEIYFKLDAADQDTLQRINRPSDKRKLTEIIAQISKFNSPRISSAVIEKPARLSNMASLCSKNFAELLNSMNASTLYLYTIDYPTDSQEIRSVPLRKLVEMAKTINSFSGPPVRVLTSNFLESEVVEYE